MYWKAPLKELYVWVATTFLSKLTTYEQKILKNYETVPLLAGLYTLSGPISCGLNLGDWISVFSYTRKTIVSFFKCSEKMVFPKKSHWNAIFLILWGKIYFIFPKIWSYTLDGKWKLIFLKKIHRYTIFFANVLKRWPFQKNCTGIWSFLYYQERWYFFFPKIWYYSVDGKWKKIFLKKKYMEICEIFCIFLKNGFLFPTNMILPFCQKTQKTMMFFFRKIHLKMNFQYHWKRWYSS